MRKLVGLLILVGTTCIGVGLWWLLTRGEDSIFTKNEPLREVQEIGLDRAAVAGSVLLNTPEGLQVIEVSTGEVKPLGGSFANLRESVVAMQQSSDDNYWILSSTDRIPIEQSSGVKPTRHYYLVDWSKNQLQRLDETFSKHAPFAKKEIASMQVTGNMLAVALIPESADLTAGMVEYTLAALALDSLTIQDYGSIKTTNLQIIGQDTAVQELIFKHEYNSSQGITQKISGKRLNSNQDFEIIPDASSYLSLGSGAANRMGYFAGSDVGIIQLPEATPLITIPATEAALFEPILTWASSGEVFALVQYAPDNIEQKVVSFYSNTGTRLYSLEVTGSVTVTFAPDGMTAVVSSIAPTTEESTEPNTPIYRYVKVFEGQAEVFSNLPSESLMLGIL